MVASKIFGKDKDLYMYAVNIEDIDMFKGKNPAYFIAKIIF